MARIEGLSRVAAALKQRADQVGEKEVHVIVGYTAGYALRVHEDLEMKGRGKPRSSGRGNYWDPPGRGQSKFLETPARELAGTLAGIVRAALARGTTLVQALLLAGLRLQRESQLRVPVDTGFLKASAFTRIV